MDTKYSDDATRTIFDLVKGELGIVGWGGKSIVTKDMENKLTRVLKAKMDRVEAKIKALDIIQLIKKNRDA